MSIQALQAMDDMAINPLDMVEEIVLANNWPYHRDDDNEVLVDISGRWCDYRVLFVWQDEASALHFCCRIDAKVPGSSRAAVNDLLARINERLFVGHFDLSGEDRAVVFRHTSLLRGIPSISSGVIEDLVQLGLSECDRYYPAFQLVMWAGKSAEEAIAASILDPVGEA